MIHKLWTIIFYMIWAPICLLLIGGVMLWAILYTLYGHVKGFILKLFK